MRIYEYIVTEAENGLEVGKILRSKGYSRAALTKLKYSDGLFLDGEHIRTIDHASAGDRITVRFVENTDAEPNPELRAVVLYDDDDIAVFDKPAGMAVHRSNGHNTDTLENLFAALYPGVCFHAVSRLDRNTSGIVVIAKNKFMASKLMSDEKYRPDKLYYAVIAGGFYEKFGETGEINAPIARENESIIKRVVRNDGDHACTRYKVKAYNDKMTLLGITLVTGRTHQIRVHFSYLGFPLLGDDLYGGDCSLIKRQALHCGSVGFRHPFTEQSVSFTAPLPEDMAEVLSDNGLFFTTDN